MWIAGNWKKKAAIQVRSYTLSVKCTRHQVSVMKRFYLYYSNDLIKVENPKAMDEDEEIETLWFSFDEIQKMLENGEIDDAKTIIALQYALLNKGAVTDKSKLLR